MNFETYQPLARRTMKELPFAEHQCHMGLGVIDEFGEMAAAIKRFFIYGKGVDPKDPSVPMLVKDGGVLDLVNMEEEGGDASWYAVGYGPELKLEMAFFQTAFNSGYDTGTLARGQTNPHRLIMTCCYQVARAASDLSVDSFADLHGNVLLNAPATIFKNLGLVYGFFDLNLSRSLERNIEKLKLRHGDKFSAEGAINRDVAAERKVLEGGPVNDTVLEGGPVNDTTLEGADNADGGIVGSRG